jgi:prolyl-tRNA editing enzyme YbaK/EbsC (Cys-tRNA(Pro) deacylase)
MDHVVKSLQSLSLSYKQESHAEVSSLKEWIETIKVLDATNEATKTLILKPSSKATNTNPIMVIALASSEFSIGVLSKSLGSKDARAAADDVVKPILGVDTLNGKFGLI